MSAIATPSATRTTPTSTPWRGPTRTSGSAAPRRRRITCSNTLRRRLAGQLLAHPAPSSPSARSTASAQRPCRRHGFGRPPTTAEITATPGRAGAGSPRRRSSASMPPIPTTGSAVAAATAESPSSPSRLRLGLRGGRPHGDAEVVGARGRRGARLVGVAHADAEHTIGPERRARAPRARRPARHGRRPRRAPRATSTRSFTMQSTPRVAAGGRELARDRQQRARRRARGHAAGSPWRRLRSRPPRSPGARVRAPSVARRHDVDPQPVGVESRSHRSLRRHYPVQVLRVAGAQLPASQPGCPSSPVVRRQYRS